MRQKLRRRRPAETPVPADPTPIDLSDTARQIALFETGNGLQHGIIDILVALGAALTALALRAFLRSGSRDRR
jgi:hypothetical protein